jgi:16S rRNA C1402 N4-methylase RsmH
MCSAAATFATEMAMAHVPVLTDELLRLLDVHEDSRVVDCTFGAGGHAEAVSERLGAGGLLVACVAPPASTPAISPTAWKRCWTKGNG